jgi:hypothetical protein
MHQKHNSDVGRYSLSVIRQLDFEKWFVSNLKRTK